MQRPVLEPGRDRLNSLGSKMVIVIVMVLVLVLVIVIVIVFVIVIVIEDACGESPPPPRNHHLVDRPA